MDTIKVFSEAVRFLLKGEKPLTIEQFEVLLFIQDNPGKTISEIAEAMGVTKVTVSRASLLLIEYGFTYTESAALDRRALYSFITRDGKQYIRDIVKILEP